MTIKEVEQILDIPRATVRFYEKEGLIAPNREGNGYRDYSEEDVERLKIIIILRKLGIAVGDIEDVFDGAQSLTKILNENVSNLEKQIEELKGALLVTRRMMDDGVEYATFDSSKYWNVIEEEEKKGHKFMTIAKDIAQIEGGIFSSYFSWTDINGKPYASLPVLLRNVVLGLGLAGCAFCLLRGQWNLVNFRDGIISILSIIVLEMILSIPIYLLGKKYPWIRTHRKMALIISCLILLVVVLILVNIL